MIVIAFYLTCISFALFFYLHKRKISRMDKLTANIPGPKPYPLIGSALEFGTNGDEFLRNLISLRQKYGHIFKCWVGSILFITLSSPDDVGVALSSDKFIDRSFLHKFWKLLMGESLVNATGEMWRNKRKMVNPTFHVKILETFIDTIDLNGERLVKSLMKEMGKPSFDVDHYSHLCSINIILESVLGTEINESCNERIKICEVLHEIEVIFTYRALHLWVHPDVIFYLTPSGRKFIRLQKYFHDFIRKIVKSKRQKLHEMTIQNNIRDEFDEGSGEKKRHKFIDTLLINGLNDDEIVYEVSGIIVAGQSTSATTISFVLYALMKHPAVQEKVANELNDIFNGTNRKPLISDIQKMSYLEMVIKETLRRWSSVPYFPRKSQEDICLKSGYILPKGCNVLIFLNELHLNGDVFQNPDVFDPERFSKENSCHRSPYAFVPFGAGPRNCIGQRYAMMKMKTILSYILRNYKILPPSDDSPDIVLSSEGILRSKTGVNIRIKKRN